jgi:hypothetical protein
MGRRATRRSTIVGGVIMPPGASADQSRNSADMSRSRTRKSEIDPMKKSGFWDFGTKKL